MLIACALALAAALGGGLMTYLYDSRATLGARLAAGYCLGTTAFGFLGYVLASLWGMDTSTLVGALPAVLGPFVLLVFAPSLRLAVGRDLRNAVRFPCRWSRRRVFYQIGFALTTLLLILIFRGTMYVEDGGLYTNNHNNLGDLPFHLAVVQGFVLGQNFPPQHPEFAGARLTYPFLVDFMVAQFVQAGATLSQAFLLQNLAVAISLLALCYRWAFLLTRRVGAAVLTPLFLIFSGGMGFLFAWTDWRQTGWPLSTFLSQLPHDYTVDGDRGLRWGNTMTALWTTQRGFLLALPLALIVWTLWWQEDQHRQGERPKGISPRLVAAGIITGMTPLVHGHTFLMLLLIGGVFALWDVIRTPIRWKSWVAYFGLALLLALPQALLLTSSTAAHGAKFFGWQPGWDIDRSKDTFFAFWWRNLGLFWPLLFFGLLWRGGRSQAAVPPRFSRFYAPFTLCFLLPNLLRFAPWIWDNIKLLFYWYVVSALVIARTLTQLWRQKKARLLLRAFTVACVLLMILSGGLDVLRITRGEWRNDLFPQPALAFANAVERQTAPYAVILHSPRYNHPILLTGRRLVMGYEGHLWSHGLDYAERKEDVKRLFAGAADAPALLQKYHIDYICDGPEEKTDTEYPFNESYWTRFPLAVQSGPYRLYRVGSAENAPLAVPVTDAP